jgi:hypothetical protein
LTQTGLWCKLDGVTDLGDPREARTRSLRLWSENGIDELTVGLLMCVLSAIFLPESSLSKATFLGRNYALFVPYLMAACFLAMVLTLKKVRAKLIFPRTGYVVFRPAVSRIWIFVVFQGFAAAMALGAVYWRSSLPDLSRAWGPGFGFVFAACLLWGGITYRLPHFIWLAGLALILGGLAFAAGAKIDGALWVMVGVGVAMALDGALRMQRFLRTHPIVENHHG